MTVDEKKCQDIIDCIERTGQSLRYEPCTIGAPPAVIPAAIADMYRGFVVAV